MPFLAYYKDPKKKKLQIIEAVLAVIGIAVLVWLLPAALEKRQRIADAVELCEFGHQMIEANNIEAAKQSFTKAMELEPELLTPYLELGAFAYFEGEYDKEIAIYRQAINNIPDTYQLHYILAESLFFNREFDAAMAEIDKAIALEPDNEIAKKFRERCVKYKEHPEQMFDTRKRNKEHRDRLLEAAKEEHEHHHEHADGHGHEHEHMHEDAGHEHEHMHEDAGHEHEHMHEDAGHEHEHMHEDAGHEQAHEDEHKDGGEPEAQEQR